MNTAIYARYSSHSCISIEEQIEECRKYAKEHNYNIVSEYVDYATDISKKQFKQMIEDSKKHLFVNVLVLSIDRFGRDRYENALNKTKLKQNGVKVYSLKEDMQYDPSQALMDSILDGMFEYLLSCDKKIIKELL